MTALATDRNTPMKDSELISLPVATNTTIFAGSIVAMNSGGYAVPGATATTLICMGRAEEKVVNAGANGAKTILVRRKKAFKFANAAGDPVGVTHVGKTCYITDDQTVSATNAGGNTQSACGKVVGLDADGVWVEIQ